MSTVRSGVHSGAGRFRCEVGGLFGPGSGQGRKVGGGDSGDWLERLRQQWRTTDRSGQGVEKVCLPEVREPLIAHLDLDAFFASVEQVVRPELRGRPVIVGGLVEDRSVVASASYEARARGVRTAMPIAQAHRICPEGIFLRGDFRRYAEFSERVMQICRQFAPLVEQASIDEAYLDLSGTERFYLSAFGRAGRTKPSGNWLVRWAQMLLEEIRRQTGLSASVGIGSNKLIAKIATGLAKPGGICFVWPGYEPAFLGPLPLSEIPGIGPRTAEILADYNLKTVKDLQGVGEEMLIAAFGERLGRMLHRCAWGIGQTELELETEPKSVSRETSFERDTTDVNFMLAMLYYLTERACKRLREIGKAARVVGVKLRYSDFKTLIKSRTLPEPSNHDDVCFAVARDLFRALYTRRVAVRLVGVQLSGLVRCDEQQICLWQERDHQKMRRIYEASDAVRDRFGFSAITKGPAIELLGKLEQDEDGFRLRTACLTR